MKRIIVLFITGCLFALALNAQHEHHMPMKDTSKPKAKDTAMKMQMADDTTMHHNHSIMHDNMDMDNMNMDNMSHAFSLNLPMSRNGSGTAWMPDAVHGK